MCRLWIDGWKSRIDFVVLASGNDRGIGDANAKSMQRLTGNVANFPDGLADFCLFQTWNDLADRIESVMELLASSVK